MEKKVRDSGEQTGAEACKFSLKVKGEAVLQFGWLVEVEAAGEHKCRLDMVAGTVSMNVRANEDPLGKQKKHSNQVVKYLERA